MISRVYTNDKNQKFFFGFNGFTMTNFAQLFLPHFYHAHITQKCGKRYTRIVAFSTENEFTRMKPF